MGGISEHLKAVLMRVIALYENPGMVKNPPLAEYLRILAELDNLLWRSRFDRSGAAMLSLFLGGREALYKSQDGGSPRSDVGENSTNGHTSVPHQL